MAEHPAFAPYARWLRAAGEPPSIASLNAWARQAHLALPDGRPLSFAPMARRTPALAYEARVARDAIVPTRQGDWHDAFNALAWLAWPRTKAALNAVHRRTQAPSAKSRSRERDAATLLDESGLLFACDDEPLIGLLRAHAWRELFVTHAARLSANARVAVVGHGLLVKLRRPYRAITAKALILPFAAGSLPAPDDREALDVAAAQAVAAEGFLPDTLPPLPVAGLPGFDVERLGERLLDDVSVFRPKVLRSPT